MMTSVFYMCRASWEMQLDGALGQVLAWLQQTQISSAAFYGQGRSVSHMLTGASAKS